MQGVQHRVICPLFSSSTTEVPCVLLHVFICSPSEEVQKRFPEGIRFYHQICDFIIRFATLAFGFAEKCPSCLRLCHQICDYHQICDFIISCANFQWFQNDNMSHDISRCVQNKRANRYDILRYFVRASKPITISDDI